MIIRSLLAAGALLALAVSAQAQTVVRDAQTGELRAPTAAEAQLMERLRARAGFTPNRGVVTGTLNPQPVRQADGGDLLEATEGDMNYSVVVVTSDGRVARHCVASREMAERIAQGGITAFTKNLMERRNDR